MYRGEENGGLIEERMVGDWEGVIIVNSSVNTY